jgi:hypothetical protein
MHVLITGATGFIGTQLCQPLLAKGWQITALARTPTKVPAPITAVKSLGEIDDQQHFDAVINLAGEPIADRPWSAKRKQALLASRVDLTAELVDFLASRQRAPEVMVSASAIGFYGDQGATELDENAPPVTDFAHQLCQQWEQAAIKAEALGIRVCRLRIGLVVGPNGGFLQRMLLPFKLGLGGPIGNGEQWMSWVHRDDLIAAILFLLEHPSASGVFNGTAPNPVDNTAFTQTLARCLHRPAFFRVPAGLLKLVMGEMSQLLTGGQRVLPVRLQEAGFRFRYPELETALEDVVGS